MRGSNKKKEARKRPGRTFLKLFGGVSAVLASVLLFAGIEALVKGESRSAAVLTLCLGFLFALLAVLIIRADGAEKTWGSSLFGASAVSAAAGILLVIVSAKTAGTADILTAAGLSALAAGLYLLKKNEKGSRPQTRIPVILGILSSAAGILTLNTVFHMTLPGNRIDRIWIGIFFGACFLILAFYIIRGVYPESQKNRAGLITFGSACAAQCAAWLYGVLRNEPHPMLTAQGCLTAAFAAVFLIFLIKGRTITANSAKERRK